ncbi:Uncharacterized protein DBV15_08752 [Temnothorax longispinosus]|uniref:Uncharacterized protein n=1 Tax=Temnothorax longispinosus TaxID=300112 RepID=A0A4S2KFB3_9HYME|nr:Uncharacterized protein DBV15_08752 [Temnothorax longispinosus]
MGKRRKIKRKNFRLRKAYSLGLHLGTFLNHVHRPQGSLTWLRSELLAAPSMARSNNNGCGRGSKHTVRRCDAAVVSRGKATSQQRESIVVVNGGSVQQRNNDDSTGNNNGTATGITDSSNASNHSQIEGTAE